VEIEMRDAARDASEPDRFDLSTELRLLARCVWSPEGLAGTIGVTLSIVMWMTYGKLPRGGLDTEMRYWISHMVGLVLIPLLLTVVFLRMPLREMGLGWGKPRIWLPYVTISFVIVYPLILWAGGRGEFRAFYPLWPEARVSPESFVIHQGVMLCIMFANEFFYRGFMISVMARRTPPTAAIVFAMLPYALCHAVKPPMEFLSSVLAGIALGAMVWRGKSIWPGVVLHFVCALTVDAFAAPEAWAEIPGWLGSMLGG